MILFLTFALLFLAFGWYLAAAIAFTLGVMIEYAASQHPPGE